ncbi:MAG: GGDEF domain-containing protein [Actinomycetota bacterium]
MRPWHGGVAVFVAVGLLVASCVLVVAHRRAADASESESADHRGAELVDVRLDLGHAHLRVIEAALFAHLDGEPLPVFEIESLEGARRDGLDRLGDLAAGDDQVAAAAAEVLTAFDELELGAPPYDTTVLDDLHYAAIGEFPDAGSPIDELADHEAVVLTLTPSLVLLDAVAVELTETKRVPEWAAEYLEYTYRIVSTQPGWFGPDQSAPFEDGALHPGALVSAAPDLLDDLADANLLTVVRAYDLWLVDRFQLGEKATSPVDLPDLRRAATAATADLRAAVDAHVGADGAVGTESPPLAGAWTLAVAGLMAAVGVALVVNVVVHRRHRASQLARALVTDALTGAYNRRHLDAEELAMRESTGLQHTVVVIDLDRFKLVNDTWGHDVGDQLLCELTRRLDALLGELTADGSGRSGSVVRMGGDEFLVLLHGPEPVEAADLERRLRLVAGPVEVGLDEPVGLELSLGIASGASPIGLDELTAAADLNAYEDKRQRRAERSDVAVRVADAIRNAQRS